MDDGNYRYITLMASLPALVAPFIARQVRISRLRLDTRLRLLDEDDAQLLRRIEALMEWEQIHLDMTDAGIVTELDGLMAELDSETLRTVIRERFELRTVLSALRRRRRNEPAPAPRTRWGYGRYTEQIRRNWTRPHFGLRRTMHWLGEVRELHDSGDTLELERNIMRIKWDSLDHASHEHEFNFDAVVLYVLRYNLIARWLGLSSTAARTRFDDLVATGLGGHGSLAAEVA